LTPVLRGVYSQYSTYTNRREDNMDKTLKTFQIRNFDRKLHRRTQELAARNLLANKKEITMKSICERALREYLDREERKVK
jgi:hypothetical protein